MRKSSMSSLPMMTLMICFFQRFSTNQIFQIMYAPLPWPSAIYNFVKSSTVQCKVRVSGASMYHHIAINQNPFNLSLEDSSLYKPDDYVFPGLVIGYVRDYVYITNASGLVRVQMEMFQNGTKQLYRFYLATQYDRRYSFVEFYINSPCEILITYGTGVLNQVGNYSIFTSKDDFLSKSLSQFSWDQQEPHSLTKPGRYYLRISYSIISSLYFSLETYIGLYSLNGNCQNQCPFPEFFSVAQIGLGKICMCPKKSFAYNLNTKKCTDCSISNSSQCTQMYFTACGNGIKQGSEQCDTDTSMPGCTNCLIDKQYTCTENFYGQSSCQKKIDPTPEYEKQQNQQGLAIQADSKTIIGVSVGVGGAIILLLILLVIVKYRKNKKPLAQTSTSNLNPDKIADTQRPSESLAIII